MPRQIARTDRIDRPGLIDFLASRHRAVLMTTRRDGTPQLSPVTCGVDAAGRLVISTYPSRAKVATAMARQGKCLIRVPIDRWGPVATGGFPPQRA